MAASTEALILADAFSEFISASSRLEAFYGDLQREVSQLGQELTERNAALNASLAENERMHRSLQQIVELLPCGVLVVENDGSISLINPEAMRLLGMEMPSFLCLKSVSRQIGFDLAGFLERGTIEDEEQEFCAHSAGVRRWMAVRSRSLFRENGSGHNSNATIVIIRDITLHKQIESEREQARRATALSEVATTLAHEIRNPLASLELFAGLIADDKGDASRWISHLRSGIRLLAGTVNNVLGFHGLAFPVFGPLNLTETLRSSVDFVRPIADEADVALHFQADHPAVILRSNSSALQQLVLNMVTNAIRHTAKGGSVHVRVRSLFATASSSLPNRAMIEFADTGTGIDPAHLQEIFRAGFSGSGNTSGLGLAVCMQIVRQHEGEIRVSSSVNCGTTFVVELPIL